MRFAGTNLANAVADLSDATFTVDGGFAVANF